MTPANSTPIDVGGLLTIDVASELRKLSLAQLQGTWQLPSELVRRALRDGATLVEVDLTRHRAEVRDNGRGIVEAHLEWVGTLLDERRANEERHAALTALEATGELVLLMVAGLKPSTLQIRSAVGGRLVCLAYERGRTPRITVEATSQSASTTVVMIQHPELDRRRAAEWLSGAARFAPVSVVVNGQAVNVGFLKAFGPYKLDKPLRGWVAIPFAGDTAHAWLLEHGLVTGHIAIPEAPCFEAVVELGEPSTTELSAARLRELIQPYVDPLVGQAIDTLLVVARGQAGYPEPLRRRLANLVLYAIRRQMQVPSMMHVPVFRVIEHGDERMVDLATLEAAMTRGGLARSLMALFPDQRRDRYVLGAQLVVIADQTERALLCELFDFRFRPPPLREGVHGVLGLWRAIRYRLARAAAHVADLVRHPRRQPPLAEDQLAPEELRFLQALRRHTSDADAVSASVYLCEGSGACRRTTDSAPRLLLPRHNPVVRACIRAVNTDPTWVYPAWLAVLNGRALPPRGARQRWIDRTLDRSI